MTISIPLVAVVGVLVWVAWRFTGLKAWQAIACLLFGFLLATSAAPLIRRTVADVIRALVDH